MGYEPSDDEKDNVISQEAVSEEFIEPVEPLSARGPIRNLGSSSGVMTPHSIIPSDKKKGLARKPSEY